MAPLPLAFSYDAFVLETVVGVRDYVVPLVLETGNGV